MQGHYRLLESSEDANEPYEDPPVSSRIRKRHDERGSDKIFFCACIATLCTTAISMALILSSFLYGFPDSRSSTARLRVSRETFRRPSVYINLEKVLAKHNSTFPPLFNFPQMVYQISSRNRRMTEDDRGLVTHIGVVYPDDRHIYISPKISTIVQFRHLDYGMENCSLIYTVPLLTSKFNPNAIVLNSSIIDVWALDTVVEISRHIGDTWKYAPKRTKKLATLSMSNNSYSFHCRSNEFSTFELSCSSSATSLCQVDFWQDQRATPIGGIHIVQRQNDNLGK
ncbi:hypothetical protein HYPSUDRAFT_164321 [Hypholoma sublateritium FD-334 SS-4]|uniref:Ubiquitin 3 binding protein But2 C-terminal domain-containing protein n=1 Tax=Hypholoma sublateritium (strain FD-334 SS-4) TaxID=945553 RepID=A0A0D2P1Z4_HYPSF|nr:hypothetical protein HYPSUDRAFT_164321 [Hypholoma sublateritium FD-334 SS-4]